MWRSALGGRASPESELDALVGATHGFTPADLVLASQRAAFEAFRRTETGAEPHALTTDDYLAAIAVTRPSLDDETIAQFEQNALLHQRL